jgi:DNA primase
MFPILSPVGKVLGFGGREFDGTDGPKYINSPETPVYHKSRVLYGLFQAKNEVRRASEAYIVEGYTDVISLYQRGIPNVVASSGTALTSDQVKLLGRYCRRVVLVYDADSAGLGAAVRGLDQVLASGLSAYAVRLPEGQDPDSFARTVELDELRRFLSEDREDFVTFKYRVLGAQMESESPDEHARVQRAVLQSIALIPDPLLMESYLKRASEVMSVPLGRLSQALDGIQRPGRRRSSARDKTGNRRAGPSTAGHGASHPTLQVLPEERTLVRLMLEFGQPLVEFVLGHMSLDEFSDGPPRETARVLVDMYRSGKIDRDVLLAGERGDSVREFSADVLIDRDEPSENWGRRQNIPVPRLNEDPMEAAESAMTLLKLDRVDAAIETERKSLLEVSGQGADVRPIQERLMGLLDLRKKIERREFIERREGA